ncbi:unnamed protein product (macronuclear) [Paramecium tetraurelia]|uniref:Uncharacterized protein n=1 Tax=Paramecium tetraurelia TaxID=5888 RepID=A0BYJ1_PARTE|nr:uncharacterized protein GSPATT00033461001 [Paramecium tetraurelia]CAK63608.1 unnamed protein product [Paramecium tetraurelia]|eukprot:XP_001431006.1 hypothetical protein (macronuclear) [Paramecium tetraurelia strain d4-2]
MINITLIFITLTLISNAQDLPDVKIYIESRCPDTAAMMRGISNATIDSLDQLANVEFIPSGKLNSNSYEANTYITNCQHSEEECYGNMILACGLQLQKDQVSSTKFVRCFFKEAYKQNFQEQIDKCLENTQQKLLVKACANGPQGIELLYANRLRTPNLGYVPSIAINGQMQKLKEDFGKVLCSLSDAQAICKDIKWV